jgi:hypothetical protein
MLPPALAQLFSALSERRERTGNEQAVFEELAKLARDLPGPFIGEVWSATAPQMTGRMTGPMGQAPTQTGPGEQTAPQTGPGQQTGQGKTCWLCGR